MFEFETAIRMYHTDAAGVIFFSRLFDLAHDCYEAFLDSRLPLASIVAGGDYLVPVVHTRADYRKPMMLGDRFTVRMTMSKLGNRSFELSYVFVDKEGAAAAEVHTTHVTVDASTRTATAIPDSVRRVLEEL